MRRRLLLIACLATLGLLQCRQAGERDASPSRPSARETKAPAAASASTRKEAAVSSPKARAPAPIGEWLESPLYRFRLMSAGSCGLPEAATAEVGVSKRFRLGVTVEVQASADQLWLTPRAATLEKNGAVIQAEPDARPSAGCEKPLSPGRLLPGQSTTGVVVFELPSEEYARSAVLAFQPPRWRGAPRFEVQMPSCLIGCDAGPAVR